MSDYFRLNTPNENKIVERQERIYADVLIMGMAGYIINLPSKAPTLKIKFFLDAVRYEDVTTGEDKYYRVGKYYELEPTEVGQHIYLEGLFWFTYTCVKSQFDGEYTIKLTPNDSRFSLYISSVVFEDSFYTTTNGWLNPLNPNNLLNKLEVEYFRKDTMNLAYNTVAIRNNNQVTNVYRQVYQDDFVEIGYCLVINAPRIFIIPRNQYRIKNTNVGSGAWTLQTPVLTPVPNENLPFQLNTKFPTVTGVPAQIGFYIPVTTNTYNRGTIFWQAFDTFNYGLVFDGANYNVNLLSLTAEYNLQYLGRNKTGVSPVST